MADFSIISDTSVSLLRMLRENLCPDPVASPESVALVSPSDKNGDFQVGVYLYDIRELSEYRNTTPVRNENNTRTRPPKLLSLSYMLFLNNKAQITAGAEIEQRIFSRAIQAITDSSTLNLADTNPYLPLGEENVNISMLNHSFEDKSKIWSSIQLPYQVGIYFTVSPVILSSRVEEKIIRVTDTQFETKLIN